MPFRGCLQFVDIIHPRCLPDKAKSETAPRRAYGSYLFDLGIRPAEVVGCEGEGISEIAEQGFLPAKVMDVGSRWIPEHFIEDSNISAGEFICTCALLH